MDFGFVGGRILYSPSYCITKMPFSIKLNGLQTDYIDSFCHKYDDIIDYTKTGKYDRAFFKAFCSHLVCLIYENNLLYTAIPTWLSELVHDIKNKKLFLTNTVDELVQRTSYSHTQFCRLFKRYFNTTFSQYLTDYKLDYSLTLLADKSKSILEISSHLGYDSTSYYITAFKKRFGVTPHVIESADFEPLNLHRCRNRYSTQTNLEKINLTIKGNQNAL